MTDIQRCSKRIDALKEAVQGAKPGVCTERAMIWTRYFKAGENRKKSPYVQIAEALTEVLKNKSIRIYPDELIVGNYSSKRVGGAIYPELHGVAVIAEAHTFAKRKTNPLEMSNNELRQLLSIVPFWLPRFLAMKLDAGFVKKLALIADQLTAKFYLINELGGVAHIAPDYEKIIAAGLARFGERYAGLAREMAAAEKEPKRKAELETIADVCQRAPRLGARTFHEALQSLFFAQIAVNLESLDNGICPGRIDQYLYPYYRTSLKDPSFSSQQAKELLAAFSIKMAEIIPVFSKPMMRFHGGMFNGQVVTVGGVDENGNDAANELSDLLLEIMDELRMRQPNFHARVHRSSSEAYWHKINLALASGSGSPALYNDEVIIAALCRHGYKTADARNYTAVGCVEPVCQGKSFSSTDAALINVPIMLEMALNEGRRFGSFFRSGRKTKPASRMKSMEDVREAFEGQLNFFVRRLIGDLHLVEEANHKEHPTPLSSMLLDGCLKSGRCSTGGGAVYNFSGIQCVGPADTGDALYAIDRAVFRERKMTLPGLVELMRKDIPDEKWLLYLRGLEKFGNDEPEADGWTRYVIAAFDSALGGYTNARGGRYVTGIYSVTAHQYFGKITGALPHGRRRGEAFASGIAPVNGMDRKGPTALLNSVNSIDFTRIANGVNLNLQFDRDLLKGEKGASILDALLKIYFERGGMQVQVNAFDPRILVEARNDPHKYPHLLVRVSGYSAYFNDLAPAMKEEIINRTLIASVR
ncbi:MAG: formate acetyltransferase [Deltaproteobacteria bacterium HGW-Deltaproteobacteria-11]|nr:MAG: formate acetyltransferase [Deltaproteobacteria bacterium HGW-Deltaproteobacteria-11]